MNGPYRERTSDSARTAVATLIIPQFNRAELTVACIRSFQAAHGERVPILVVDDGSRPSSLRALQSAGLSTTQVIRRKHRGLTAAWNAGLHHAETRWLVFLNNDVTTHGPWLDALLQPLVSGCALLTGVASRTEHCLPPDLLQWLPPRPLLAGWCFAVERELLRRLGGFDESLRLYFSDTDLQLRLLPQSNFESPLLVVPGLPLLHVGHATTRLTPNRRRLWRRDRDRFVAKWSQHSRMTRSAQVS